MNCYKFKFSRNFALLLHLMVQRKTGWNQTVCLMYVYSITDTIETSRCNCTKPCTQSMYEPGLSQAALSILSVDSILSADTEALERQYHSAIESHQRVNDVIFVRDLQLVADIQRHYLNLRRFAKTYLGDFDKSSFAKVLTCLLYTSPSPRD